MASSSTAPTFASYSNTMAVYEYTALCDEEVRLMVLFPGEFNDDIYFELIHKPLVPQKEDSKAKRLTRSELQSTLSGDWKAFETPEGQYFFAHDISHPDHATSVRATHPNPNLDPTLYGMAETVRPANDIEYEALSYVWGSMNDHETAWVKSSLPNSTSTERNSSLQATLQIGRNLASALRHLRHSTQSRTLWVDAVCINQNDMTERSLQVQRMGSIYSLASRVIVWLGREIDSTPCAFSTLQHLGEQLEISNDNWYFRSPTATEPNWSDISYELPYDSQIWEALVGLFNAPWFQRLWIMQEIRLANRNALLRCGHQEILASTFRRAIMALYRRAGAPKRLSELINHADSLFRTANALSLPNLLLASRDRGCSDPRDKVYGVLSIAPPSFAVGIRPQYTLPVTQVYQSAFITSIESLQRLDLLPDVHSMESGSGCPSWVPDWSMRNDTTAMIPFSFQSAGISRAHYRIESRDSLEVVGVYCTRIRSASKPIPNEHADATEVLRSLEPDGLMTDTYSNGESLLQTYLRILQFDQFLDRYPERTHLIQLDTWKETFIGCLAKSVPLPQRTLFPGNVLQRLRGASLLTTEDGHLGFGPSNIQPGDIVAVLLGCYAPMVLRPSRHKCFTVVGRCYIQGLMDGEALLGPIPQPWRVQQILIDGYYVPQYLNTALNTTSPEDPRLETLPSEWELIQRERAEDDPLHLAHFRNRVSGEEMNSDPRLLPDALATRGVKLKTFTLV